MGQEYNQGWFNAIRMYMTANKLVYFRFYVRHICYVNLYIAVPTLSLQDYTFSGPSNLFLYLAQNCF